jgi:hypothetical protein
MRFSALLIVLAFVAVVAPNNKNSGGGHGDQSGVGRKDSEQIATAEARQETSRQRNANARDIKSGSASVTQDDIDGQGQSIEQQKADAIAEKHRCDCDACKMHVQGQEQSAYDNDMLACHAANEKAKADVAAAVLALAAAKEALEKARSDHRMKMEHETAECNARASTQTSNVQAKQSATTTAQGPVNQYQSAVNMLIAEQDNLRAIAMERDLTQFRTNQAVVNAQYKLLEGRDEGKGFFRKFCMCDNGRVSLESKKKGGPPDVYYHEAYENILQKKDGSECSESAKGAWVNTVDPEGPPVEITTPVWPARNPKCVAGADNYNGISQTGTGGKASGGTLTQQSQDRAAQVQTDRAAAATAAQKARPQRQRNP